jgi:Tfp pilus assembly protein PilF
MKIKLTILMGLILTACGTKKVTKSDPVDQEALKYNHLAVEQQMKQQPDSGLYYINKAIQIDSSVILFHVQKTQFLWWLNRDEEALQTAKTISKLREYRNLTMEGLANERLNNLDKAKQLYKQTVDNWPEQELEENYQARLEYAQLVTVVYGRDKGIEEINKIDRTKIENGQDVVIDEIKNQISEYTGVGYLDLGYGRIYRPR